MTAIPVVADAETLFRASTRAVLIHLDYQSLIKLHWSPILLAEMIDALVRTGTKTSTEAAREHERRMNDALPNAMVPSEEVQQQFRAVQPAVKSFKDLHVAACACALIAASAYGDDPVVPTGTNVKDFKSDALDRLGILLRQPDTFSLGLNQLDAHRFAEAFRLLRLSLTSQPTIDHRAIVGQAPRRRAVGHRGASSGSTSSRGLGLVAEHR